MPPSPLTPHPSLLPSLLLSSSRCRRCCCCCCCCRGIYCLPYFIRLCHKNCSEDASSCRLRLVQRFPSSTCRTCGRSRLSRPARTTMSVPPPSGRGPTQKMTSSAKRPRRRLRPRACRGSTCATASAAEPGGPYEVPSSTVMVAGCHWVCCCRVWPAAASLLCIICARGERH